ncbi:ABC transporter permease, partial [Tenuifilum sp.]|uniref:ABC transporter permease n=1 Tax=Tenuifilum sp. TaxID=2760880 RepID=UPI002CF099CE|nr:ABC transporter permease [Tenuifilum sp.]
KISLLLLLSAIQSATFVIIANSILEIRGMYFDYWLVLFSTAVCANLLGLNISASFNSAITIYIVIPLLMIPMMVLSGAMFSFEKLNRSVGSFNRVPLIAEFMITKWGYEALVVHQYKDNAFQKIFYDIDKVINNANYKTVYYIDELEKRATDLIDLLPQKDNPEVQKKIADKLAVLRKAIINETTYESPSITFNSLNKLSINTIDEATVYAIFDYLDRLKSHYSDIYSTQSQKRERMISFLVNNNRELYEAKRRAYDNESLADLATKTFEKNKIVQYGDELVQQYDPVYRDPIPRHYLDFRSHFLAPRKHFLGMYFDTFWFNLVIIWLMTIALYITLYYESLKKLLDFLGKIKIPTLKK